MQPLIEPLFDFMLKRHDITLSRAFGVPWPWTADPILQKYRFTNVYRELDTTTVWYRNNIAKEIYPDDDWFSLHILNSTIYRWFNNIRVGSALRDAGLFEVWDSEEAHRVLTQQGPPFVNGAYIIKTPNGLDKLNGVLWCIDNFVEVFDWALARSQRTLKGMHGLLKQADYLGDFMAYEIVCDLRYTPVLENAPDVNFWGNVGPGAKRGLNRLFRGQPNSNIISRAYLSEMLKVFNEVKGAWPHEPKLEVREIEHSLCEFDKYERARLGEGKPKQLYKVPR